MSDQKSLLTEVYLQFLISVSLHTKNTEIKKGEDVIEETELSYFNLEEEENSTDETYFGL